MKTHNLSYKSDSWELPAVQTFVSSTCLCIKQRWSGIEPASRDVTRRKHLGIWKAPIEWLNHSRKPSDQRSLQVMGRNIHCFSRAFTCGDIVFGFRQNKNSKTSRSDRWAGIRWTSGGGSFEMVFHIQSRRRANQKTSCDKDERASSVNRPFWEDNRTHTPEEDKTDHQAGRV